MVHGTHPASLAYFVVSDSLTRGLRTHPTIPANLCVLCGYRSFLCDRGKGVKPTYFTHAMRLLGHSSCVKRRSGGGTPRWSVEASKRRSVGGFGPAFAVAFWSHSRFHAYTSLLPEQYLICEIGVNLRMNGIRGTCGGSAWYNRGTVW